MKSATKTDKDALARLGADIGVDMDYDKAKAKIEIYVANQPLCLQVIDRPTLEAAARTSARMLYATVAQECVIYLRHRASRYDSIIRTLNSPGSMSLTPFERHVLLVHRRSLVESVKLRIFDEIAELYPWLREECIRQKHRMGLEEEPGVFQMPFGPYKGLFLRDLDSDYLIRLLGMTFVRGSMRCRVERELARRQATILTTSSATTSE
jgi:hypothetical protein